MVTTVIEATSEWRWWASLTATAVRQVPGQLCVLTAVVWLTAPYGVAGVLGLVVVVVAGRWWARRHPARTARLTAPLLGHWWRWRIRRHWSEICTLCDLVKGEAPELRRSTVTFPHVRVVVRPAPGQTMADLERAAEAIRVGLGVERVRVAPYGVRDVELVLTVADQLRFPFDASSPAECRDLTMVPMGRREDGRPWDLAVGPHTLVAGCSGAGKASLFWSFAFGLAPAVRDGRVRLHGIDLKGGMEVLMGRPLFSSCATSAPEAAELLESLVRLMQERTRACAGRVRLHTPTVEEPLHVVMIDELAGLTAYCSERDVQRRAETALNLLCSQGRAPGFVVFACLQDPRKEVIPARGLFTQMIGLRLKDLSETAMVLGEGAVVSGALCHRITRGQPGVGYVVPEEGGHPVRVRAGFASDEAIRDVAARFGLPSPAEVV